ncbi:MAG: TIGR04255 family protein [Bacteroidales bacterium]
MFGFPTNCQERESLNHNFLKSVVLEIQFNTTDSIIKNKESIKHFFSNSYPRLQDTYSKGFKIKMNANQTPVVQPISDSSAGFQMRSQDGQSSITFSKDRINISSSGKVYSNFEDFFNGISEIQKVFKKCDIKNLTSISIRKINIIDFEIPGQEKSSPMDVLAMVLSPDLLSNLSYFPAKDYIKNNIHTLNFIKDNNILNLKYGLISPDINKRQGQIVIDIDLIDKNVVNHKELESISKSINDELFNVFFWTLCDEAIETLKGD